MAHCVAYFCLASLAAAQLRAGVIVPAGLAPGSQYQFAFLTYDSTTATSSNIADYNRFAASEASLNAALPAAADGVTWNAVVSTASLDAINNAPTYASVPIYNTAGQLVASNSLQLWSGSLVNPIAYDQFGTGPENAYPYTGTGSTGHLATGWWAPGTYYGMGQFTLPAGSSNYLSPAVGQSNLTNGGWAFMGWQTSPSLVSLQTTQCPVYALSSPITVTGPAQKYFQFDPPWSNQPLRSGATDSVGSYGCCVTSLCMGLSMYGVTETPTQLCSYISQNNMWCAALAQAGSTSVNLNAFSYPLSVGAFSLDVTLDRTTGYDTIANDLRAGHPVMLCVPAQNGANPINTHHFILAYGLSPTAPATGSVAPTQIRIYDPGYDNAYANYKTNGVLTLDSYFEMLDDPHSPAVKVPSPDIPVNFAGTSAQGWFNSGTFYSSNVAEQTDASKLVNEFVINAGHPPTTVTVHSPVDMVIVDPTTGKRYVSSAALQQPGDTLLSKDYVDNADDISGATPSPLEDPFPAYSLLLPDELHGKSLDVSMVGIGSGSYEIDYQSSDPSVLASPALSGTISTGQTESGQFTVTVTPEPSALALLSACAVSLLIARKRKRV
jgi:hypothetical protein